LSNLRHDILKTLAYFDFFSYPLTPGDIQAFLPQQCDQPVVDEMLGVLVDESLIFKLDDFYSLRKEPLLAKQRRAGNERAEKQLDIAKKVARLLAHCPYVEAIAVSGSLSKHFADEKADIDFFIVTTGNRLWIARTCMHFLKKLSYIAGKQHWFCMNYYVDEMGLDIPEKNIFTAMEITTLIPMEGTAHFNNFIDANPWIRKYFPAHTISTSYTSEVKKGFLRKCLEKIFNSRLGDITDRWLMNITDRRWGKKASEGKVNDHGYIMGMLIGRHFCKQDPQYFQQIVLQQYENKVKQLPGSYQQTGILSPVYENQ
jgi:hypothetical protein